MSMFGRFSRGKKEKEHSQAKEFEDEYPSATQSINTSGFICPMCMVPLPGPAELQNHFEEAHGEGDGLNMKTSAEEQADVIPDLMKFDKDSLNSTASSAGGTATSFMPNMEAESGYRGGHLELEIDENAADIEKELVYLRQDLNDMSVALKEEKWYSSQLKKALDKITEERNLLDEESKLNEDQYTKQLRSAEEGFLAVAEENERLKKDLLYADYNFQKERHEKMKTEIDVCKVELEGQKAARQTAEESLAQLQDVFSKLDKERENEKQQETGIPFNAHSDVSDQEQAEESGHDLMSLKDKIFQLQKLVNEKDCLISNLENTAKENIMKCKSEENGDNTASSLQEKLDIEIMDNENSHQEVAILQESMEHLTRQISEVVLELSDEKQQHEHDNDAKDGAIKELEENKENVLSCLQEKLDMEIQKNENSCQEVTILHESMEQLTRQISEVALELSDEKQQHKHDNKAKDEAIKELQITMDTMEKSSLEEIESLTEKLKCAQNQLKDVMANLSAEITNKNESDNMLMQTQMKVGQINTSLEQKDDILKDLQSRLEIAEQEVQKPCISCKNYELQLCRLQEATKDQSGQIENLNSQILYANSQFLATEENRVLLEDKIEEIFKEQVQQMEISDQKIVEVKEANFTLESRIAELDTELKGALADCEKSKEEKDNQYILITEQEERLRSLLVEKDSLESEISAIGLELSQEKCTHAKLIEECKENERVLMSENKAANENMTSLQKEIEKEQKMHSESKEMSAITHATLKEDYECLQSKLECAISEKLQVEKEIEALKMESISKVDEAELNVKKIEKAMQKCEMRIKELELNLEKGDSLNIELKGDIAVLEAQIQNSNEEKKVLLDRVLQTEEQLKLSKKKASDTNRRLDQALAALQELGQENQNLQIQQVLKTNRQWENDSDVTSCKKCGKLFNITIRKHHCRSCGVIFCKECTRFNSLVAASKKPVRVCEECFAELGSMRGTIQRRLSNVSSTSSVR